ncbi:MAG: hypothetical protein BAJATHORv1_150001 [Candidatus Thorarchaeota archaeon]|nr:MAG: hypothetical protein BAJATHORv1_150001 [Candidatus Thorarchaeota archaeon]
MELLALTALGRNGPQPLVARWAGCLIRVARVLEQGVSDRTAVGTPDDLPYAPLLLWGWRRRVDPCIFHQRRRMGRVHILHVQFTVGQIDVGQAISHRRPGESVDGDPLIQRVSILAIASHHPDLVEVPFAERQPLTGG